ncbi:MAG: haloacid dehalogenase type II [Halioglobus sp.]
MLQPKPNQSPARGEVPIEAVMFDTFGTVCDFYQPFRHMFSALAEAQQVDCDSGRLAIDWRTAYVITTATQAMEESPFRPLREINRSNLEALLQTHFPKGLPATEIERLSLQWERLPPWPDAVPGLLAIKELAIVAPLSNGNFADMVRLSRHAKLPWDIILGSSLSGFYKPHPQTYLKSIQALALQPEQVCMVAAHQVDLAFAAGHGMQTAFVPRPEEFGGATKPENPEPGVSYLDAAEIHAEEDWTYMAEDFLDLARQLRAVREGAT